MSITGADGWPSIQNAGNVLRPVTKLKLSIRIPPRVDPKVALAAVKETLEKDPPYGAKVMGEGGTIPFMYMLGEKFPRAQFCITGVLGPGSNAHGPNEFLHIPSAKRLT